MVNEVLSRYSDWSFTTAIAIYTLSMAFYLVEQAFGRYRRASVPALSRQLVAAGGGVLDEAKSEPGHFAASGAPGDRSPAERLGRMAVALTALGSLLHLASIALRGMAVHRWPLGNMYEYISFFGLVAVVSLMVMMRRFAVRRMAGWVLLPIVILMFADGTALYTLAAPVQPALQSYWIAIHVTAAVLASGVLLIPGVASAMYLIRTAHERNSRRFARLAERLPASDTLDQVAYRATIFAFPLFTFGVICGAIWAESAWGSFWSWDPKETTAFVAWVVYAAYLHSRATAGWRGNRAAVINVVAFAVMIFNLFFVNLVTTGLHSYAGLS